MNEWHRTIGEVLGDAVTRDPRGTYVTDAGEGFDRRAVAAAAGRVRRALVSAGVAPGDVVSVQLANSWRTVAAMHGAWALGAIVNPVPTIYRDSELVAIMRLAQPVAVVVSSSARGVDFMAQAHRGTRTAGIDAAVLDIDAVLSPAASGTSTDDEVHLSRNEMPQPTDVALVMFTSGTTGTPKGVLHSHRTLLYEAASIARIFDLEGRPVFMPSPLAHITGLLYGVLMPLLTGGSVSLLDRWDPAAAVDIVEHDGCTFTVAATPFLRGFVDEYSRRAITSSLRAFVCGGADIPPVLVVDAERTMGVRVIRTYGSTEMPTLCIVRPDDEDDETPQL